MNKIRHWIIIIFLTVTTAAGLYAQQNKDAVCDVELKGTDYALHLVELGDNLFRIAQKYNSSIEDIWDVNPSIVDNTIMPGQVIKIPRNSKDAEVAEWSTSTPSVPKKPVVKMDPSQFVYHEVGAGQTLFSISRMYSVTVEELMAWNDMQDYNLSTGETLIVSAHGELKVIDDETAEVTSYKPSADPIRRPVSVNNRQDVLYERYVQEGSAGLPIHKERGAAEKLITNNPAMQDVYYALHKTAPVGAVMKVTNLVNRKYVFVTVLAPLPDINENENIRVKLSPAATKEIILLDGKSLVELSFHEH